MNKKIRLVLFCALCGSVCFMSCGDERKSYYANLAEAAQYIGENEKAWLHDFFFADCIFQYGITDITECHDLDTNARWGSFSTVLDVTDFFRADYVEKNEIVPSSALLRRLYKIGMREKNIGSVYKISAENE